MAPRNHEVVWEVEYDPGAQTGDMTGLGLPPLTSWTIDGAQVSVSWMYKTPQQAGATQRFEADGAALGLPGVPGSVDLSIYQPLEFPAVDEAGARASVLAFFEAVVKTPPPSAYKWDPAIPAS